MAPVPVNYDFGKAGEHSEARMGNVYEANGGQRPLSRLSLPVVRTLKVIMYWEFTRRYDRTWATQRYVLNFVGL